MSSSGGKQSRAKAWIRWVLFSEGLILLWAVVGPGYRHAVRRRGDHALLARLITENPTCLEAVAVNAVAMHIFVACAWGAAWVVTRLRGEE